MTTKTTFSEAISSVPAVKYAARLVSDALEGVIRRKDTVGIDEHYITARAVLDLYEHLAYYALGASDNGISGASVAKATCYATEVMRCLMDVRKSGRPFVSDYLASRGKTL